MFQSKFFTVCFIIAFLCLAGIVAMQVLTCMTLSVF